MNTYLERQIERSMRDVSKVYDPETEKYKIVDEYGHKISTVSEKYRLVKNSDVIQPIIDHFGVDRVTKFQQNGGGQFCFELTTGREFEVTENDRLSERILLFNSYNKSKAFTLAKGAFRFICSNGMFAGYGNVYRKIHVGDIPVDELVTNCIDEINDGLNYDLWKRMATVSVDNDTATEFVDGMKLFDLKDDQSILAIRERRIKYLTKNYERNESPTVWGLYNRVNWAIKRTIGINNPRNLMTVNNRVEDQLVKHFSLN